MILKLSQTAVTLHGEPKYSEISLEMIVIAIIPCSSPLLDDKYLQWPCTSPEPETCMRGSKISDTWPVDMIQAWEECPSLYDASLAAKIVFLECWMDLIRVLPSSEGTIIWPQMSWIEGWKFWYVITEVFWWKGRDGIPWCPGEGCQQLKNLCYNNIRPQGRSHPGDIEGRNHKGGLGTPPEIAFLGCCLVWIMLIDHPLVYKDDVSIDICSSSKKVEGRCFNPLDWRRT